MENGRLCDGNDDVVVVTDHCSFGTFVKNDNVAIVSKGTHDD